MEIKDCFVRIVHPADWFPVTIAFADGRLSIMGSYNGSTGQISGELKNLIDVDPDRLRFGVEVSRKLYEIWDRWHLNDMRAGTPRQEEAVRELRKAHHRRYTYDEICEYLKEIDLYEDGGYRYGSAWLKEEVPQDVLRWLFSLPGEGSTPDDVCPVEIDEDAFVSILSA